MSVPVPLKVHVAISVACVVLALAVSATAFLQRMELEEELGRVRSERDSLSREIDELENDLDEATNAAEAAKALPSERAGEQVGTLPPGMSRASAEQQITETLMDGGGELIRDLTGLEGVLGGTFGFFSEENITILNDRWVHASFEDGHVGGEMLLRYTFGNDGEISWTLVDLAEP